MTAPNSFPGGMLPSEYPEVEEYPALRRLFLEQLDPSFSEIRRLLLQTDRDGSAVAGSSLAAAALIFAQIVACSRWFCPTEEGQRLAAPEQDETGPGGRVDDARFTAFVRAYYPHQAREPRLEVVAEQLLETRNALAHEVAIVKRGSGKRRRIYVEEPATGLSEKDVVGLEALESPSFRPTPFRKSGRASWIFVPGLYWALVQMLRSVLRDQPLACETAAKGLLETMPIVQVTASMFPTKQWPIMDWSDFSGVIHPYEQDAWEYLPEPDLTLVREWTRRLEAGGSRPEPFVSYDLTRGLHADDFDGDEYNELEADLYRCTLHALQAATRPDEWIYAVNDPNSAYLYYRFWPHRATEKSGWYASPIPNGDDQYFLSQDLSWGIVAHFGSPQSWWLDVFGQRLLDAYSDHTPKAFTTILERSP